MKIALKIFNVIILALAAVATVFLFTSPTLSFNSNIGLDVQKISEFVPETDYTHDINIQSALGTDEIHVRISFDVNFTEAGKFAKGDRETINNELIINNVKDIVDIMHEPVELIADFSIRSIIKSTIKAEITKQIDAAREQYGSSSSTEDIMDEVGMNDAYFKNFSYALYDAAIADGATVDSLSNVLFEQIDNALALAEDSHMIDNSSYTEEKKVDIKNNLVSVLTDLKLIKDDGVTLKNIRYIPYRYFADYLYNELVSKVEDPHSIEQGPTETDQEYSDRLMEVYVLTQLPDAFYTAVGTGSIVLLITLYVFAGIWGILIVLTIIRMFSRKKPWTVFGPWFWIIGSLQIVLGIGITVFGKYIFPALHVSFGEAPIKTFMFAPRTFALIPSILFISSIVLAIVYGFFKRSVKNANNG